MSIPRNVTSAVALSGFVVLYVGALFAAAEPSQEAFRTNASVVEHETQGLAPESENHGLSPKAVEIARPFGFPITNSMVVSWVVAVGLIVFAQTATRKMQEIPTGAQNFLEFLVGGLYRFLEGIIGPHLTKRTFWFFATIFIFILSANWLGLIPGVGSVGWGHQTAHGFQIDRPLLR